MTVLDSNNNEYTVVNGVLTITKGTSGTGVMQNFSTSSTVRTLVGEDFTTVVISSGMTSISDYAFYRCTLLTTATIPNSVTSIGTSAFSGCTALTSITVPSGVTAMGDAVFAECTSLTSVVIRGNITSIGSNVFNSCSSLTSINIPSGVTSIGGGAFMNCVALTSISIPSNVTSILAAAFFGCTSLSSVGILGTTPATVGTKAFASTTLLYVSASAFPTYLSSWTAYASQIRAYVAMGISLTNATASDTTGTKAISSSGYTISFTPSVGFDLVEPTVTIAGSSYTGSTWSAGTLYIPASAIVGTITITETAVANEMFSVRLTYTSSSRRIASSESDPVIGTVGDENATLLYVSGLPTPASPLPATYDEHYIVFDVRELDEHVVKTKKAELTYDATNGWYCQIPSEVFNNTLHGKLPVQLMTRNVTVSDDTVTVNRRYFSLNMITFLVAPAIEVFEDDDDA